MFWVDLFCISNYKLIKKVVTFDTNLQDKQLPFEPWNILWCESPKSSIIDTTEFLSKEDIESFVWVFTMFLECMTQHQHNYY